MRPFLSFTVLIALAISLSSCPYESSVPLDTPSSYINSSLLGTWRTTGYPYDSTEVSFSKKNDYEYYIEATLPGEGTYDHYSFTGYFCSIKDGVLLNFKNAGGENYIAAVWLNGSHLTIKALSETITTMQFTTSAALKQFIEKLYANGSVKYDDETTLDDLRKVE